MTCVVGCICACGQLGCGCRETAATPPTKTGWPTCSLCGGEVKAYVVVTLAQDRLLIKFCPTCDVRRCAGPNGCGHYEQESTATRCSACGVGFR